MPPDGYSHPILLKNLRSRKGKQLSQLCTLSSRAKTQNGFPQLIEAAAAAFIIFTFFHGSHLGCSLQPSNELTAANTQWVAVAVPLCVNSFTPHNPDERESSSMAPCYRWQNWGSHQLPRLTQLLGRGMKRNEVHTQGICSFTPHSSMLTEQAQKLDQNQRREPRRRKTGSPPLALHPLNC